jgi:ABC-type lipoprotein export system ATPase subunit
MAANVGGLRNIVVRGLFGSRDYAIPVERGRPTVLTGVNGTGKSTLLRLINAVSEGDLRTLGSAPLNMLELHFAELDPFTLLRTGPRSGTDLHWGVQRHVLPPFEPVEAFPDWARSVLGDIQGRDEEVLEDLLMEAARSAGVPFSEFTEVRSQLQHEVHEPTADPPPWAEELSNAFPVAYVTDQRLVVEPTLQRSPSGRIRQPQTSALAVEVASRKIANEMRQVDSAYARTSQQQDRRFPRDVIAAMSRRTPVALEDLKSLLSDVDERRESLRDVGLLDRDYQYEPELDENSLVAEHVRPVIQTVLQSTLEKLGVLENLAGRLQVFQQFLNRRFADKAMELSRRNGVRFRLKTGGVITPSELSSGEQQMMVLAYEILFRTSEGTLVMVDEPEISLHVLWQDTLIDDLTAMGSASDLQFLLATHSPVLLGGHPELERSLDVLSDS